MKTLLSVVLATALAGSAFAAQAAEASASMQPTVSIPGSCSVVSPGSLTFGAYDATAANLSAHKDVNATFVLRCNKGSMGGSPMKISLGPGLYHNGAGCLNKRMANGAGTFLNYEVHTVTGRTAKWGCMSQGENGLMGTYDTGADFTITMYGRLPAGQAAAAAGSYSDTMDIILSF